MTKIYWKQPVDGDFAASSNWGRGVIPGPDDAAILNVIGQDYTATSDKDETVAGLSLRSNATLAITEGVFDAVRGTGTGVNAGMIAVSSELVVGGTLNNWGQIAVEGGELSIAAYTQLTGRGQVILNGYDQSGIFIDGKTLVNVGNTISGGGQIGSHSGDFHLVNDVDGVIDASASEDALLIMAYSGDGGTVTNDGLIESTGTGYLYLHGIVVDGVGRAIAGGAGSSGFVFDAVKMMGQSLSIDANGQIGILRSTVVAPSIRNAGGLNIQTSDCSLTVTGALVNTGAVYVESGATFIAKSPTNGSGQIVIWGAQAEFLSSFNQPVDFSGSDGQSPSSGLLVVGQSQAYSAPLTGFSNTGGTTLDLRDIGFVGADEATFKGTATSGVLTVSDGVHTSHIKLAGNYLGTTFVASKDGHGGVTIVDTAAQTHRFAAAMAGMINGETGLSSVSTGPSHNALATLVAPGIASA